MTQNLSISLDKVIDILCKKTQIHLSQHSSYNWSMKKQKKKSNQANEY